VIGKVENVSGVKTEGTAVGTKEVGEFATAAAAGAKEGAGRVVAGKGCGSVA